MIMMTWATGAESIANSLLREALPRKPGASCLKIRYEVESRRVPLDRNLFFELENGTEC